MICHWDAAAARQDRPAGLTPTDTALSRTHRYAVSSTPSTPLTQGCLTAYCTGGWVKCSSLPNCYECCDATEGSGFQERRWKWKHIPSEGTQRWKEDIWTRLRETITCSPMGMKQTENSSSRIKRRTRENMLRGNNVSHQTEWWRGCFRQQQGTKTKRVVNKHKGHLQLQQWSPSCSCCRVSGRPENQKTRKLTNVMKNFEINIVC